MESLFETLDSFMMEILLMALFIALLSIIIVIINFYRTTKIIRQYKKMMRGMDNKNLEHLLLSHLETVEEVDNKINKLDYNIKVINHQLETCIQKVGIVRYNPFDQMGSDQSFSVALLNKNGDGVVLTGLYSRQSSAIFAKPIISNRSNYPLSDEEQEAIELSNRNSNV